MPKQINTHLPGQALVKLFGLKGRFQPVLDETIVPVVQVSTIEDVEARPAIGGAVAAASGAGNQNLIYLANRSNTGIVVEIIDFWAISGAPLTDFIELRQGTANFTPAGFRDWRDSSLAGLPAAGFNVAVGAAAVLGAPSFHLDTDSIVYELGWSLQPGDYLLFRQNAQNQTLDLNVRWRERNVAGGTGA